MNNLETIREALEDIKRTPHHPDYDTATHDTVCEALAALDSLGQGEDVRELVSQIRSIKPYEQTTSDFDEYSLTDEAAAALITIRDSAIEKRVREGIFNKVRDYTDNEAVLTAILGHQVEQSEPDGMC